MQQWLQTVALLRTSTAFVIFGANNLFAEMGVR
jgi:hypothetical protein